MTAPASRTRRILRAIAINGALLGFSLLFAGAAAEVAVRVAAPQQLIQIRPDLWQPADTIGWMHRPNVTTTMNTGEGEVHVYTDREGFRVGEAGRVEDGTRVLLIGDSFMEALQVEYEQSLAGLLQAQLPTTAAQPVAIRNAGIDGWGPSHYVLRAGQLLPRDDYRLLVVTVFIGNDIQPARLETIRRRTPVERHRLRLPRSLSKGEVVNAVLQPVNDALEVRSHAYLLVRNRMQTLRMRAGVSPLYMPQEFMRAEATSDRWETFGQIAADIDSIADAHGARTLFVLIPAPFQVDERQFEQYLTGFQIDPAAVDLEQPTRLVTEQLTSRGLRMIDALPAFRAAHAEGVQLYGAVDPHLTPAGHERLAGLVLPAATELLTAGGAR